MRSPCRVPSFNFFPWCGFRDTEVQSFSIFPIWLPHPVTYDVIIIIKTFYMSSRTNGENCLNPTSGCGEKHESSVLTNKQTDRQTNRQTNKQTDPNAIPSPNPLVRDYVGPAVPPVFPCPLKMLCNFILDNIALFNLFV